MKGVIFAAVLVASLTAAGGSSPEPAKRPFRVAATAPPLPWNIPRTIRTTDGHTFHQVTIRYIDKEGVVINYRTTPIKLFYAMLDGRTLASIQNWNP